MAYLRRTTLLESGKTSTNYVFGGPNGLINLDEGKYISYSEVRELLKNEEAFPSELEKALDIHGEELDLVSKMIFIEKKQGLWKNPSFYETFLNNKTKGEKK